MKIRSHLYLLAVGAIAPLLAASVIAGIFLVVQERATFEREALGRARSAMSAVDAELRGAITTMQALAASKNLASGDIRAFHEEARRVLATQQPHWRNIGLASTTRVQLMDANRPFEKGAAFGAGDESFELAIRTRLPTVGDVTSGPAVSGASVRIRLPVLADGAVRYVLSVPIDPASFHKVLAAQQLPDGWAIGLVDRGKQFIARIPVVPVGTSVSNDLKAAIERAPQGWFWGRTLEGAATYTPYVTSGVSGWVLAIAIPAGLVEAAGWRTFWLTFSGVLAALAIALALAWLIARRIADPITSLAVAAQDVNTGTELAARATQRIDEIARLHDALAESARAVRERQALLESKRAMLVEQAELLDLAHDAIMMRTADGVIKSWSSGAEETFGWSKSEAIGQRAHKLLRTESARPLAEIEAELNAQGRWEGILMHTRKDGGRIVVASRWALRREQSGKAGMVLEINRDITRQTTAEESIARLNQELMEASRRKDNFLATLAHELRNPLAPITNSLSLLKMANLSDAERTRARDVIERQVGQMARLLDDLFDVSRITHGKLELRRERVALAQVVETATEIARPMIKKGGQELIVALGPRPLYVDADPVRLAQIISNLLANAVKYSNAGNRIWLTVEASENQITVSVRDEGIGISPKMLPRVFDIFAQGEGAAIRAQGGMGIGLALVRALTELHGGTVQARSEGASGKGSEFIVHLPALFPFDERGPVDRRVSGSPSGAGALRFLVADDLADSADSLALLLRQHGHEVHTAYDGEQALETAARVRPRIAVLDLGMPKLNGFDLARKIREQPWGKDILLVALSGWGQQEDRRRSKEAGFNHHLVKPLDFDELAAVMKTIAER